MTEHRHPRSEREDANQVESRDSDSSLEKTGPTRLVQGDKTLPDNSPPENDKFETFDSSDPKISTELARIRYFGKFELLEEIARGGMGVVYKARELQLNRIVALKMILTGQLASAQSIRRFMVEAEACANLDHPGIVPVYEYGEVEQTHYFSMAFIDGPNLAKKAGKDPMPPEEAARLILKLAEAIAYAHSRGVVHRDLKPANILLESDGQPRITDFGLAKLMDSDENLTQDGAILGSVKYMSPEQATGNNALIGPPADIYALGSLLYELLTGRPPFLATTAAEVLSQVIEREPVPPRRRNPDVPLDLETICLKCLQKEIPRRFLTAEDLAEELRRFLRGEPIRSRPIGRWEYLRRWCRRNPLSTGLIAGLAAVLLIGVAATTTFVMRAESERQRFEEQQRTVETLSRMVLRKTLDQTEDWLSRFFEPVERELLVTRDWTYDGLVHVDRPQDSIRHFTPLIDRYPQISSLRIADDRGREHMLLCIPQTGSEPGENEWLFRHTRKDEWGDEVELTEWTGPRPAELVPRRETLEYDPRETVWYQGGISKRSSTGSNPSTAEMIHWTDPYVFFVTKDLGITATLTMNRPETPDVISLVSFDVLLMDITRYTIEARPTPRGKIVILSEEGKLLGLPHGSNLPTPEDWKPYFLTSPADFPQPVIRDAAQTFEFTRDAESQIRSFESGRARWWGASERLQLSEELSFWILILLPESDLHERIAEGS